MTKCNRLTEIIPVYVLGSIPDKKQHGVLYISLQYITAIHLCACGCGGLTATPINKGYGWEFSDNAGKVSLSPSIGNFAGEDPYHAHYFITDNKVVFV